MKNLLHFNGSMGVQGVFIALSIQICTYAFYASNSEVIISNECQAATLILPQLPTYLSCTEAAVYVVPDAWYDNYESGICENNGYIVATVIYPDPPCGFPMEIIYEGFDDFGNPLYASVIILVDMAPEPTYDIPYIPETITCEEAANFHPPIVTYSNGETGMCERSGTINASFIDSEWDYCNGGFIHFYYDHMDMCLHYFYPDFRITVLGTLPAVLTLPELPLNVACEEAPLLTAPDATFSNGMGGECANGGTIAAEVVPVLQSGYVDINYAGLDNCGHLLNATHRVHIESAEPIITMPFFPDTLTVTEAASYIPPAIVFSNGLLGDCGIYLSIPYADFHNIWDVNSGGYISLTYNEYLYWLDEVYFIVVRIEVVPDELSLLDEFCTMGQGAYGNSEGMYCNGQSQREVMDELLYINGGMVLGLPDNNRSFTIPANGGQCIEDILPGGGPSAVLTGNYGCGNFGPLLKNGRLKNQLLAQTIAMQLNLWLSPGLDNVILESHDFITVGSSGCGEGSSNGSTPLQDTLNYSIPLQVYNHLTNLTIQEIFTLANEALGTSPWPSGNPSLSSIADAVATINEAFDGCRFIYFPGNLRSQPVNATIDAGIELTIAPNPFLHTTEITFSINNDSKVYAEIYDMQARLITRLFEGYMKQGTTKTLHYTGNGTESQSPRLCVIRTQEKVKHQVLLNMGR